VTIQSDNRNSWRKKLVLQAAFLLIFLSFIYWGKQASPNRDDAKLEELQQLSLEIHVFPGFRERSVDYSSRATDASVYKSYFCSSSFKEVEEFYTFELSQKGWIRSHETNWRSWFIFEHNKELTFQKDEFIIAVAYTDRGQTSNEANYSVSFVWRSKNK
jgi:hypothetical protein